MSSPTVSVEVAFASNPLVASPTWTDITPYVRELGIKRGRTHELEHTAAGSLTMRLRNTDRRFDPTFADGNLIPLQNQRDVEVALGANELTAIASATVARTTTAGQFSQGVAGLSITAHATNSFSGATVGAASTTTNVIQVVAGLTYTFAVKLKGSGAHTFILRARWLDAGGTAISNSDGPNTVVGTGAFTKYTLTAIAPEGAAFVRFQILYPTGSATQVMYADEFQAEAGSSSSAWPAAAPYYPNVVPMKQVRVRALHNAVTYDLFRGFVDDWGQGWPDRPIAHTGDAECTVRASDAFKILNMYELLTYSSEVLTDEPVAYWRFADPAGSSFANSEGSAEGADLYPVLAGVEFGVTPGPLLGGQSVVDMTSLNGLETSGSVSELNITGDLTLECWIYPDSAGVTWNIFVCTGLGFSAPIPYWLYLNTGAGGAISFAYWNTNGDLQSVTLLTSAITTGAWHHVALTRQGRTITGFVDGVQIGQTSAPGLAKAGSLQPLLVAHGAGTVDFKIAHAAIYAKALGAERIAAHADLAGDTFAAQTTGSHIGVALDILGWPAGLRDLDAGLTTLPELVPSGSALSWLQAVAEDTEGGLLFIAGDGDVTLIDRQALLQNTASLATFGDLAGEVGYSDLELRYDDVDLYSRVIVERAGGSPQIAEDAAVATAFGPRDLSLSGLLLATDLEAVDRANGLLARYDAPEVRFEELTLLGGSDTARFTQILARTLGDRVTINRRPPGSGDLMTRDVVIEGIEHRIRPAATWSTSWSLVPAIDAGFWILGDASFGQLGQTTVLAY